MDTLTHLYFAYGSNLNFDQMARRCPGARLFARGILSDHQFIIFNRGYATLIPMENEVSWGGIWKINQAHLVKLDAYEGVSQGLYQRESIPVQMPDSDNQTIHCEVYFSNDTQPGTANPGYMEAVIKGAQDCRLPAEYINKLKCWL